MLHSRKELSFFIYHYKAFRNKTHVDYQTNVLLIPLKYNQKYIASSLTIIFPIFIFCPHKNIKKPKVFCFQKNQERTLGRKRLTSYLQKHRQKMVKYRAKITQNNPLYLKTKSIETHG